MIGAVVLAAGRSRRFGHRPKLAARLGDKPVLGHTLEALRRAPARPIVVVTGAAHARIATIARAHARCHVVRNPDFAAGMAGSLQCGLRRLPSVCDFALIVLGDMPALNPRLLERLCANARSGVDVVRPVRGTRPGHPVVVSRRLFEAIARLQGDRGARRVIDTVPASRCIEIASPHGHVHDIDTPDALRRLRGAFRRGPLPGSADNRDDSQNQP